MCERNSNHNEQKLVFTVEFFSLNIYLLRCVPFHRVKRTEKNGNWIFFVVFFSFFLLSFFFFESVMSLQLGK